MNRTKRLTGVCSECGGPIQFPAELVGTMTQCPRCRKQTELMLAVPTEEEPGSRKMLVVMVVAIGILVLTLIATVVGLKHFEKLAARQKDRAALAVGANESAAASGIEVSAVSLEKGQAGNEVYAVGTVVNTSNRPRSRVTVEFDLLDARGHTLQVIRAYRPVLELGAKWELKVPVAADSKAVSARLASIKEGQ